MTTISTVSPCTGVCESDPATGWCLGCARTDEEIADWRDREPEYRAAVWDSLPARFVTLGISCRRLPWTPDETRAFVVDQLARAAGVWTMGVVGAVGEFASAPGDSVTLDVSGDEVTASTRGGVMRLTIDAWVRALAIGPADDPETRIALVTLREKPGPERHDTLTLLGPDADSVDAAARDHRLYDVGLDRDEGRFCFRLPSGPACDIVDANVGAGFPASLARIGPALMDAQPVRVIETALGRMEISAAIPPADGCSPAGPHTHLLPDHVATGRATPAGVEIPQSYRAAVMWYPPSV